jgi:hypothetical protein
LSLTATISTHLGLGPSMRAGVLVSLLLHAAGLSALSIVGTHDALPDSDDGEISQLDVFTTFAPPPEQAAPTPPPPPQVAQAPEPPPPPPPTPPADLDPEKVRLGIDDGAPNSKVWKGSATATEHHAAKSEVDQAAHSLEPGVPGPAQAGDPGPSAPLPVGPPAPDEAPQSPATDQPQPSPQPAPQSPAPQPAPPDPAPQPPAPQPEQQPQPEQPRPQQPQPQQPLEQQPEPQQVQPQQPIPVPAGASPVEVGPTQPDKTQPKAQQPEPQQEQPQQLAPAQPQPQQFVGPQPAPASADKPDKPNAPRPPATKPATPKSNSPDAQPGQKADDESAASSVTESLVYRPGHPLAGKGLQVRTVNPRWGVTTMLTSSPRNTVVRIRFGRSGKVLKAAFLDGGTGYIDIDGPLLDAVYRWIAQGEVLKKIPTGDPQAGLNFDIKFIMQQ